MRTTGTFVFIDLAGFTALTEARGDDEAADVAEAFFRRTKRALGKGDRLIKTIGDAVLVTSPTAEGGLGLVERLIHLTHADARFPALRAGLHHGSAEERRGDVFGAAVNLAARVSGEAFAGEVLGTKPVADAAADLGIAVAELGDVALKNVKELVPLYSLAFVLGESAMPICPVCRVPVDQRSAIGNLRHNGKQYWFCSMSCAAVFASNPGWHEG